MNDNLVVNRKYFFHSNSYKALFHIFTLFILKLTSYEAIFISNTPYWSVWLLPDL